MEYFLTIVKIAGAIKKVYDWLFGDGGLTKQELNDALAEAVNEMADRTFLITQELIEKHQYQSAHDKVESLAQQMQEYHNTPEKWRLESATTAATNAWNSCNNNLDLIDRSGVTGKGLLGHPMFLIAASLRFIVLKEWIRIYKDNGSSDQVNGALENLRNALLEGISTAKTMEDGWIDWSDRRFGQIKRQEKMVWRPKSGGPHAHTTTSSFMGIDDLSDLIFVFVEYKWIYEFNGDEYVAWKLYLHINDDPEKIQQGALEALARWEVHKEREMDKLVEAFVEPSKKVRKEWKDELSSLSTKNKTILKTLGTIEEVSELARWPQMLRTSSFWKAYPELRAKHADSEPEVEK